MDELTLTGATLISKDGVKGGNLEMTPVTNGHNHSHSHSHSHQKHTKSCCSKSRAAPIVYNIEPPSSDELKTALPTQVFEWLQSLTRLGLYSTWKQVLENLQSCRPPQDHVTILSTLGPDGHSLLHWAAKRHDDPRILRDLLQVLQECNKLKDLLALPSKDKVGMTPLHWACTEGSIPGVALLLNAATENGVGTGMDTRDSILEVHDASGCTPLLIAAQYGHVDLVAYLLVNRHADGASVDVHRDSALHWAAYKGSIPVCGLLLYQVPELEWNAVDSYGQTPIHLASLRGHTSTVRYLLNQAYNSCTTSASVATVQREIAKVLTLPDKNGKTPMDLARQKKFMTVVQVLQDALQRATRQTLLQRAASTARQFCSYTSWKVWLGCHSKQDEMEEAPHFPHAWMIFQVLLATLAYPFVLTPMWNTSEGLLWDYTTLHAISMLDLLLCWYAIYKTKRTNPGCLAKPTAAAFSSGWFGLKSPSSCTQAAQIKYRQLYNDTLASLGGDADASSRLIIKLPLCHSCNVARPLRSKHCRIMGSCILMMDHFCPFVANTVGLDNYPWFYAILFYMTLWVIYWIYISCILLSRSFSWTLLFFVVELALHIIPAGGMLIYHTQLTMVNLTTNEHLNVGKYSYLHGKDKKPGRDFWYKNPFFKGWYRNAILRLCLWQPTVLYELPESYIRNLNKNDNDVDNGESDDKNGTDAAKGQQQMKPLLKNAGDNLV